MLSTPRAGLSGLPSWILIQSGSASGEPMPNLTPVDVVLLMFWRRNVTVSSGFGSVAVITTICVVPSFRVTRLLGLNVIVGGSPITTCAPLDHFGMAVGSLEELEGVLERAKKYRERDDRVEVVDHQVEDHGMLKLHNCYFRYLLPMMVEIQYYEMGEDAAPQSG